MRRLREGRRRHPGWGPRSGLVRPPPGHASSGAAGGFQGACVRVLRPRNLDPCTTGYAPSQGHTPTRCVVWGRLTASQERWGSSPSGRGQRSQAHTYPGWGFFANGSATAVPGTAMDQAKMSAAWTSCSLTTCRRRAGMIKGDLRHASALSSGSPNGRAAAKSAGRARRSAVPAVTLRPAGNRTSCLSMRQRWNLRPPLPRLRAGRCDHHGASARKRASSWCHSTDTECGA